MAGMKGQQPVAANDDCREKTLVERRGRYPADANDDYVGKTVTGMKG